MGLPSSIERAAARYKTIEADGHILFPVLVKEYDAFLIARPAIDVMHQSLPVRFLRMPLLSALYQMYVEEILEGKPLSGLFSCAILALSLSLRLGEGTAIEDRLKQIRIAADPKAPEKLFALRYDDPISGAEKQILPTQYPKIREIIALQNGVKLESDYANPDLVRAQKDMDASGATLDANIEDLISAVSAISGVDENEIDLWPIRKLNRRAESYRRMLDYVVCGFGEVNGTTWSGGNPTPHPFFARAFTASKVLSALDGATGSTQKPPSGAQEIAEQTKHL